MLWPCSGRALLCLAQAARPALRLAEDDGAIPRRAARAGLRRLLRLLLAQPLRPSLRPACLAPLDLDPTRRVAARLVRGSGRVGILGLGLVLGLDALPLAAACSSASSASSHPDAQREAIALATVSPGCALRPSCSSSCLRRRGAR